MRQPTLAHPNELPLVALDAEGKVQEVAGHVLAETAISAEHLAVFTEQRKRQLASLAEPAA